MVRGFGRHFYNLKTKEYLMNFGTNYYSGLTASKPLFELREWGKGQSEAEGKGSLLASYS